MDFAAVHKRVTMDEGVDERLMISALNVIRHFLPRVRSLEPHLPRVAEDERLAVFQQGNQTPGILGVIQSIDNTATFVLPVPSSAEHPRPAQFGDLLQLSMTHSPLIREMLAFGKMSGKKK